MINNNDITNKCDPLSVVECVVKRCSKCGQDVDCAKWKRSNLTGEDFETMSDDVCCSKPLHYHTRVHSQWSELGMVAGQITYGEWLVLEEARLRDKGVSSHVWLSEDKLMACLRRGEKEVAVVVTKEEEV